MCFFPVGSSDHTLVSGTLIFDNIILQCFTFDISDDDIIEGDEFFTVEITDFGGASEGNPTSAIVTIQDNDGDYNNKLCSSTNSYIISHILYSRRS